MLPFFKNLRLLGFLPIILIAIIFAVIFFFTYYIFFASPARIEVVLPPVLEESSEIAALPFKEIVDVVNGQKLRTLENRSGVPTTGLVGRLNPFIDYRNGK